MSNSIYSAFHNSNYNQNINMIQAFNRFRQSFKGDPKQTVMSMLSNGQITQQQLNEAQNLARQLQDILK